MRPELLILIILAGLLLLTLLISLVCFFMTFFSSRKESGEEYPIPPGKSYEPYKEEMIFWMKNARNMPHKKIELTSRDGLKLRGKYFELEPGLPIEILFHGYRGSAYRDLSGGIARCFEIGHNALVVDHRASGESEGHIITFGIKEKEDLLLWVDYVINSISADSKIILTGISMGAATVMLAAGEKLPENVIGILADCGYTSNKEIIKKVVRNMHLPANLFYPFIRLGARIFGGFSLDSASPEEAMKKSTLPIIFFHGDKDSFVPMEMSEKNFEGCASPKKRLVIIKGAGHGLAYPCDKRTYCDELQNFFISEEIHKK